MEIENVIKEFKRLGFSNKQSRSYSSFLMKEYAQLNLQLSNDEIISTIENELTVLTRAIEHNTSKELILLPEVFDHKYGHWHSLMWIVGRYYMNANKDDIPPSYMKIVEIINTKEENRMCSTVAAKILHSIKSMRESH